MVVTFPCAHQKLTADERPEPLSSISVINILQTRLNTFPSFWCIACVKCMIYILQNYTHVHHTLTQLLTHRN